MNKKKRWRISSLGLLNYHRFIIKFVHLRCHWQHQICSILTGVKLNLSKSMKWMAMATTPPCDDLNFPKCLFTVQHFVIIASSSLMKFNMFWWMETNERTNSSSLFGSINFHSWRIFQHFNSPKIQLVKIHAKHFIDLCLMWVRLSSGD